MKALTFSLLLVFMCLYSGCTNDMTSKTLPEATQTGRGIFACYVDGKPFIDTSGSPNRISFNCFYQLIDGEYYFGIQGNNTVDNIISVGFNSNNLSLNSNQTYQLLANYEGNLTGRCDFYMPPNLQEVSDTNENYSGELYITKLDLENQII